jgi:peroxiredoxin
MRPLFRSSLIPARVLLVSSLFFLIAAAMETAQAQVVTLSATSVSFGNVAVGSTSAAKTVRLTNTSTTTALSISSVVASANFSETNTCGTSVAAGGRCVITITITPTALGAVTGSVVITDNATPATQTITLTGTGVLPIAITPASHNFGSVGEGTTSAVSTFTVRNYQATAAALTISTAAPFAQTNTCASVAANSTCTISATFSPTTTGAKTGSLTVSYTGLGSPLTATLTGTGVLPIAITPASHNFGSVGEGTTSAVSTFTVRNYQATAAALTISTAAPFAQTNTCASVAANSSCTISTTFSPTTASAQTGSLTVSYTGTGSPQTATLTGTGALPITLSTTSVTFGSIAQGSTSNTRRFSVTNNTTAAIALTITSTNTEFAATGCASVAAGASCNVSVTFTPSATAPTGTQTGSIEVAYTGTGSPQTVSVTGTSVAPLTAQPNPIYFGENGNGQLVGTASSPQSVTITNLSTSAVTIGSIVASPAAFALTGNTCSSLAAAASCAATVVFTPAVAGTTTGTLTIPYGTSSSQLVVSMTGQAQVNRLTSLVVTAPSASVAVNASEQFTATGTYSNGTTGNVTDAAVWTSSSTGVATVVRNTGVVTGVTASSTAITITATVTESNGRTITATAPLTVTAATNPLTGITLTGTRGSTTPVSPPTIAAGTNLQLYATGKYSDGSTADITTTATWSSNGAGATVSGGMITAVSAGDPTISASLSGITGSTVVTVTGKTLTGVTLTGTLGSTTPIAPPTLAAGTKLQLYATGTYSDGSTQDITSTATWSSSTTNATVVAGLITAVSAGDPTISASLSGITGSTSATVTAATLVSIAITPAGITTVAAGNTQQFTATGTYTDSSTQNITSSVTWSSSEASVTMSTTTPGLAQTTDQAVGTSAKISAALGNVSAATPATLTVNAAALVSIAVTPANASIPSGTTEAFTATGTYTDNSTQNLTSSVTWSAATLSGGGAATFTFTGNSSPNVAQATVPGMVTITATSGSISGSTPLTVTAPILISIVVTSTAPAVPPTAGTPAVITIYQGRTQQFYALGTYSDSSIQNITDTVAWSTGNASVATVSTSSPNFGLATAVGGGTVAITATSNSIISTTTGGDGSLTVTALNSITVTPANPTAALGDADSADPYGATNNTLQFTATANYADSTTGNVTASATWTSGTPAVATIGGATGLATLLTAGSSTITAAYAGVSGTTQLTVTAAILESVAVCLGPQPSTSCGTSTASVGVTLGLNATQQFSALGTYSDGSTQDLTSLATWAAETPQEVTITAAGLATVVATDNNAHAITASYGTFAAYQNSNTGWITASTAAPISCPSPTIDMKLLVVNDAEANSGAGYADFPAIQQILNYVGTPYEVVDVSAAAPMLSDGACHGYYQGVIFAYGGDYYNIPTWQSTLISYEQTFNVRQVNWYDTPDPNFGLSYTGTQIPDTSTYTTNFTAAAAPVFFYANTATPLTITNASVDLAAADAAAGGSLTPLLQDASGNIVSAIYNLNGQQFLSQTFDSNPYLTHDLVVAYGLLNWVTKGVFLGDYHVYATQEVDDFFIDDSEWIPSTTCLTNLATKDRTLPDASNLPVFRVDAADMAQLVTWQTTKQTDPLLSPRTTYETGATSGKFELTIAMNGVGTSGNGDWTGLTAPIVSSSAAGGVASFTAQDFTGQVGQSVTVTNTTNGGGVLNGTWTIASVTKSAATTPSTTTFTANVTYTGALATNAENGADGNAATATASVADDLVGNLQSYQQYFHWISHTYDHPTTLNGLCQSTPAPSCGNTTDTGDDIDLEVKTNLYVASSAGGVDLDTDKTVGPYSDGALEPLTFTDFNPGNIVTPGVTGLNDPNVPGYLYADGIRYAVSDTSVATTTDPPNNNGPNPLPNVGIVNSYEPGIYEVPRHPNDVFYNVANWGDDDAEFICIYSNYVPPGSTASPAPDPPFNTYNAAQVLDFTSTTFVNNMLMGDMDPEMFHQPDLHFSDNYANLTNAAPSGTIPASVSSFLGTATTHVSSLLSDTYDLTFSKYEALYNLPVLTPTLDQLGGLMQNRNSFNLAGVTASIVGAGTASATLTITMPSTATSPTTAVIPVTGLASTSSELYGGQTISHINMTPGQTITFPLP